MTTSRRVPMGWLLSILCCVTLLPARTARAASFPEFVDPNPAPGNQFGLIVVPLSTGNVVVTSPGDDFSASNAGAVYLFNGATGVLISTLRGAATDDGLGTDGVRVLPSGDFVVLCTTCNVGGVPDAGAVTRGSGATGISGTISFSNSLAGTLANDQVGSGGVTVLANGNYVVASPLWNNGAATDVGAVTWCDGTAGRVGAVAIANSLIDSSASDLVGVDGVTALASGNYVVASRLWNNGGTADVGAVTWCNGETGRVGGISVGNSLVGSTASDQVGLGGAIALTNGNYVVRSLLWNNGAVVDAGAVTWCEGTAGRSGTVSAGNSLVGSTTADQVGTGVTVLPNGNYVVRSPLWNNGAVADVGAAAWCSGITETIGAISAANSLIGFATTDQVGSSGVTALTNGNYVVRSPLWNNGGVIDAGAATWGDGASGVNGVITASNSLVGSVGSDLISDAGVVALANGNYVVQSPNWNNGSIVNAGAATWGNGTTGITGALSPVNSLVGSTFVDGVGGTGVTALTNGHYVVRSALWNNAGVTDIGAATWGDGTVGVSGVITAANSLVGSSPDDRVSSAGVTALANGNYVVQSEVCDPDGLNDAGAATWGNGATGTTGAITSANSLVGSAENDKVGHFVTALSNGNYVVTSPQWNLGTTADGGAVTWGGGTMGITGAASADNSIISLAASTGLLSAIDDPVNGNFISRYLGEDGGHVRAGPMTPFVITSALDIPGDQGGWLRLTFQRHYLDHVAGSAPITSYGIWRHVPGTVGAHLVEGEAAATLPPGTWELVTSVPALQQSVYVAAVPTIANAAANDYIVTAHSTTPSLWFVTASISGQSVDNLAPSQPMQFAANYTSGQTQLTWAANPESDIGSYSLHRGSAAGFTPTVANRIASQIGTSYSDVGPAGSYYKLCAVDVNGNPSTFALVTPAMTTDVEDEEPVRFAFDGVHPNPASARGLHAAFALPNGDPARLELLDVSGRVVITREVGSLGAGRHVVNLADGRSVRAGIYWVRLTQGRNRETVCAAVVH